MSSGGCAIVFTSSFVGQTELWGETMTRAKKEDDGLESGSFTAGSNHAGRKGAANFRDSRLYCCFAFDYLGFLCNSVRSGAFRIIYSFLKLIYGFYLWVHFK